MLSVGQSRLRWRRSWLRRRDMDLLSSSPTVHGYQKSVNARLTALDSLWDSGKAFILIAAWSWEPAAVPHRRGSIIAQRSCGLVSKKLSLSPSRRAFRTRSARQQAVNCSCVNRFRCGVWPGDGLPCRVSAGQGWDPIGLMRVPSASICIGSTRSRSRLRRATRVEI